MKTLFDVSIKLKYRCNFVKKKSSFENVNEFMKLLTLKLINVNMIVFTKLIKLNEKNSVIRRCFLFSINTIISQNKQNLFTTIFTNSKILLSMSD